MPTSVRVHSKPPRFKIIMLSPNTTIQVRNLSVGPFGNLGVGSKHVARLHALVHINENLTVLN